MRDSTLLALRIICLLLLLAIIAIAYAWHVGVLDTFAYLYESFESQPTALFELIQPYASYGWILPIIDSVLMGILLLVKPARQYWWALLAFEILQLSMMIAVMYSTRIVM